MADNIHFPWLDSPGDLWEKVEKDSLHCLRNIIYIAKIPNPKHFCERTKSWATLLWQELWREAVLTSPDTGRKHNCCLGVDSAEPMLPWCIPADGLRSAGVLSSLRSTNWNRNPVWKYTLLFFSILKERQKNRAAPLHSERLGKQFSALDGIHFKPCPSSTTVTTTEKILFK